MKGPKLTTSIKEKNPRKTIGLFVLVNIGFRVGYRVQVGDN